MVTKTTFYGLIDNLERYLLYQQDKGTQWVQVDREVLDGFAKMPELKLVTEEQQVAALPELPLFSSVAEMAEQIAGCVRCPLSLARTHAVPGNGCTESPDILFVGGAPDAADDQLGVAFDGEVGALLTKMIEAMGYQRNEVFVTHAVKCRPPEDRPLTGLEQEACFSYLERQIELIQPKIIVAMGAAAVSGLTGKQGDISWWRGTWFEYKGIQVMPTYHPATLLRDVDKKRAAWKDLQMVMSALNPQVPAR